MSESVTAVVDPRRAVVKATRHTAGTLLYTAPVIDAATALPTDVWASPPMLTDKQEELARQLQATGRSRCRFAFASVRVYQCARAWLSSSDRPRCRPSMIDQNREHFMGSLAGHCRPCSSAVRATSIRCCCSASSANL